MAKLRGQYELGAAVKLLYQTPPGPTNCFYGYYTQSPLGADGRSLLVHRTSFDSRPLTGEDIAEIGHFNVLDGTWQSLGETRAFNWQQGSMLQWLGPDFATRVIFNDQEGDSFVARVASVDGGQLQTVSPAIYAVHPNGESALAVRFERHFFTRAYHYEGVRDPTWNVPMHPDDGIFLIDLRSGQADLVIRTQQIADIDPDPRMAGVAHWLEHLLWNPSGSRFAFLHRFKTAEGFATRVFTANSDGSGLWGMSEWREWSWSHMAWRDDRTFVLFSTKSKPLGKKYAAMVASRNPLATLGVQAYRCLKRFIPKGVVVRTASSNGYAWVEDGVGMSGLLSTGLLVHDGHPSWTQDHRFMLTDTYALEDGCRHLLLYDASKGRLHVLGRFHSPLNACGYRCDLHPRFSFDDRYAIIDTLHSGVRQTMVFVLDWSELR